MINSPKTPDSSTESVNRFEKYSLSDLLDSITTNSAMVGQATINMSNFAVSSGMTEGQRKSEGLQREAEAAEGWEAEVEALKAEVLRRFSELTQ